MRIAGFNGRQIREGTCNRGKGETPCDSDEEVRQATKIRGPVCPNFIASSIAAITAPALERLFNRVIAILAANSFFPKKVNALLDASEIQSTEQCTGCGKVKKRRHRSFVGEKNVSAKSLKSYLVSRYG